MLEQSISINDDHGQMTNKKTEDEEEKLHRSSSNLNENSPTITGPHEPIHKTSSNSNVFSRLMHSELHVSYKKISNTYQPINQLLLLINFSLAADVAFSFRVST